MRVVYDTNVYISGLFWTGPPRELIKKALQREVELFTSEFILDELATVLLEDFKVKKEDVLSILRSITEISMIVYPREQLNVVRDKKDNRILECALEGDVEYIVTGDNDLLILKEYHGIKIVSPREFLSIL